MNYDFIYERILIIYQKCNVKDFPIDCFSIVEHLGYKIKRYCDLTQKKLEACMQLSEDACLIGDAIYYNTDKPIGRIRFSIMHEIGHIVLDTDDETAANYFASHILAARIAIHYAHCKNKVDVATKFQLTSEAATYAFNDYSRWHRRAVYKMTDVDRNMYDHFYDENAKMFVYTKHDCVFCDSTIYNSDLAECKNCSLHFKFGRNNTRFDSLYIVDDNWLYKENIN